MFIMHKSLFKEKKSITLCQISGHFFLIGVGLHIILILFTNILLQLNNHEVFKYFFIKSIPIYPFNHFILSSVTFCLNPTHAIIWDVLRDRRLQTYLCQKSFPPYFFLNYRTPMVPLAMTLSCFTITIWMVYLRSH